MAGFGSAQSTSVWPIQKLRFEVKWDTAMTCPTLEISSRAENFIFYH